MLLATFGVCATEDNNMQRESFSNELSNAVFNNRLDLAEETLSKNNTINLSLCFHSDTPLHLLTIQRKSGYKNQDHIKLSSKLIQRGVPINAINKDENMTALGCLYGYKTFDRALSSVLINAGALLMVSQENETWNIIKRFCIDNFCSVFSKNAIFDSFYKTFARDYSEYKQNYLTTALIFKRFGKEKKVIMPRVLVKYIGLLCIDPTEHIEATIADAVMHTSDSSPIKRITKQTNLNNQRYLAYDEIKPLITPGAWQKAFVEFQSGKASSNNLIVKALAYVKEEKDLEHK